MVGPVTEPEPNGCTVRKDDPRFSLAVSQPEMGLCERHVGVPVHRYPRCRVQQLEKEVDLGRTVARSEPGVWIGRQDLSDAAAVADGRKPDSFAVTKER